MRRFIPWSDLAIHGTIILFSLLFAISFSLILPEAAFPAVFAIWAICGGMIVVCGTMLIQRYFAPPDYTTKQGVSVWTEVRERTYLIPTLTDIERFVEFYIEYVPEVLASSQTLSEAERAITGQQLTQMFKKLNILFTKKPSALSGFEWWAKDRGCAQRSNLVAIRFFSPFTSMHIYHVLFHAIDTMVLERDPDPEHKNVEWWKVLDKVQSKLEEKIYGTAAAKNLTSGPHEIN